MTSLPHLFALAHGVDPAMLDGPESCLFCGAPCRPARPASSLLRDTFGAIGSLARPASRWACEGCALCMREDCEVPLCDGTRRRVGKAAMRMHSWAVTPTGATAYTKAHRAELAAVLLDPPTAGLWGASVADSGQKQLLYMGVVNQPGPGPGCASRCWAAAAATSSAAPSGSANTSATCCGGWACDACDGRATATAAARPSGRLIPWKNVTLDRILLAYPTKRRH